MNPKVFEAIRNNRIRKMTEVSEEKRKVYATPVDEFYNLRRSAKMCNTDISMTWKVKMMKQLVTVFDMMEGRITPTQKLIDEKVGDVCVYMTIAEGILMEKMAQVSGRHNVCFGNKVGINIGASDWSNNTPKKKYW